MILKFTKHDLLIVVELVLLKFGVGFIGGMVIPIFPSLIRIYANNSLEFNNFNVSSSENNTNTNYNYHLLSILFVAKNLCQIILSPIVGCLVEIFGAMILLLGGTIFQLITLIVYGLGDKYYLFIIGRVFEAISTSVINCASAAWVAYRFKDHSQRGFVYGVKALSYCVGSAVGPAYGGVVYQYYGKSAAFLSFITFIFVELVLVALVFVFDRTANTRNKLKVGVNVELQQNCLGSTEKVLSIPRIKTNKEVLICINSSEKVKKNKDTNFTQNFSFFKDIYFLISVGTFPVVFISIYLLNSSLSRYMVIRFNASESQQGIVWIVNLLGHVLGFISGNIINTKLSQHRHLMLVAYTGLHAFAVVSIPFMPSWWSVSIPLCVIVHVHLVAEVVLSPLLAAIVEKRHSSRFGHMSGIIMMSTSITGTLGSFLGPILLSTIGFMYMNIGVSALNIAYAPLYLFLRKISQSK